MTVRHGTELDVTDEEAFARLRDEIWVRSGGALPRVVLVASARRGEGRTSVAAGLGRALAGGTVVERHGPLALAGLCTGGLCAGHRASL